ncbi:unnamed protein product [Closterium sp. NIES-64]|nr:unnamed protein product [Closterium sp. NIES-64]
MALSSSSSSTSSHPAKCISECIAGSNVAPPNLLSFFHLPALEEPPCQGKEDPNCTLKSRNSMDFHSRHSPYTYPSCPSMLSPHSPYADPFLPCTHPTFPRR